MKTIKYLTAIGFILMTYSCSSTYQAGTNASDDVYWSSKDAQSAPPPENTTSENYNNYDQNSSGDYQNNNSTQSQQPDYYDPNRSSSQTNDGQGNTYITNNYNGDYYDYEYSSKIRRYYEPASGYGYYDPYYTNSYWYNYNPASWGMSIYLGYNWWAPASYYYDPFCYGGFSIGFGYGYGYPYSGYPVYPYYPVYGYPYYGGSYYHGYNHGYWDGYNQGYNDGYYGNPYYYNSYDPTSFYYGPRGSSGSNSPHSGSQRSSNIAPLSEKYEHAIVTGRVTKISDNDVAKSINVMHRGQTLEKDSRITPQISNHKDQKNSTVGRGSNNTPSISNESKTNPRNNSQPKPSLQESPTDKAGQDLNRGTSDRQNTNPRNSNQPSRSNKNSELKNIIQNSHTGDSRNNNSSPQIQERNKTENKTIDRTKFLEETNPSGHSNDENLDISPSINQSIKKESRSRQEPKFERQENNTPVFTPRDEPKQYRQESAPSRSQPSQPSHNNSGGGRRR
jgi:hypothetical protein